MKLKLTGNRKRFSYPGRVAIITGGSRGLGLLLARQLRKEGARVALLACNREELVRAKELLGDSSSVLTIASAPIRSGSAAATRLRTKSSASR